MEKLQLQYEIRWMIRRDLHEVLDISNSEDNAWAEDDFLRNLRQRNCIGLVVEFEPGKKIFGKLGGFMIYELSRSSMYVLNFIVHECQRRRGIGTAMVDNLKKLLVSHRRKRLVADVPDNDKALQLFFRKQGFKATKVIPGVFDDGRTDAYRFVYNRIA